MQSWLPLIALAFLGSLAGLIGGVIFLVNKTWARKLTVYAVPFAAGVLLAVAFLDLLPEAVEAVGNTAFFIVLAVFVVLFLVERFLFHLHHHDGENTHDPKEVVPLVIFGDTVHNFLDGVAIGTSYLISPGLGLVVALATFFHETPHEIADFGILLSAGWKANKVFWANFFSACATFPGAFLAVYYSGKLAGINGILVSVAAGFFLYVATTDFLPQARGKTAGVSFKNVVAFLLGIALIVILGMAIPHA